MILIDTHVLLWTLQNHPRLGGKAAALVVAQGRESSVYLSMISIWEIALSASGRKLDLGIPPAQWFDQALKLPGLIVAGIEPSIAIDAANLPTGFHKDPADRLIVATARQLDIPLVTADEAILRYAAGGHLKVVDARH